MSRLRAAAKVLRTSVPALMRQYRRDPADTFDLIQHALAASHAESEARKIKAAMDQQARDLG